VLALICAID